MIATEVQQWIGGGELTWGRWVGVWDQFLRTTLHIISISLQNSFCESHTWRLLSWKALRENNAQCALPLYLVSEDEKWNGSDEKSVKRD